MTLMIRIRFVVACYRLSSYVEHKPRQPCEYCEHDGHSLIASVSASLCVTRRGAFSNCAVFLTFFNCPSELLGFIVSGITAVHCGSSLPCAAFRPKARGPAFFWLSWETFLWGETFRRLRRGNLLNRVVNGVFSSRPRSFVSSTSIERMYRPHPTAVLVIVCRSLRHCSQKYSSGLAASSMIPTQPPCCQTLQTSH